MPGLSFSPLRSQPTPGRDTADNLVRAVTCICDSHVATRGSVFGPKTLVTEPLSPLPPQVQTDLYCIELCRAAVELLMPLGQGSPTRAHPSTVRGRSRAKPLVPRPSRIPTQGIMIGRQQRWRRCHATRQGCRHGRVHNPSCAVVPLLPSLLGHVTSHLRWCCQLQRYDVPGVQRHSNTKPVPGA